MKRAMLLLSCLWWTASQAVEPLLQLNTRPGVTQRLLLLEPAGKPVASLILFTGGGGCHSPA